jgi:processive 1,2-diacylglycerol beta-glucosyltransferase
MNAATAQRGISILYLSFGSGHRVAAEALAESLNAGAACPAVIPEDPFSNLIRPLPAFLAQLQGASITLAPDLYQYLWLRHPIGSSGLAELGLLQDMLMKGLTDRDPGIIVTTHVIPCVLISALRRSGRLNRATRLFSVITDYALNAIWPTEAIDGYFVAHEELRSALIYRGVRPERVHVTGIPIKQAFNHPPVPRTDDGLQVLIVAGGQRSGGYRMFQNYVSEALNALRGLNAGRLRVTVVTGNQSQIRAGLQRLSHSLPFELEVKGYVNSMAQLMAASDILIAKPGGLTIAEALASGIPMIVAPPAPGVETANVDFLARHAVGLPGGTAQQVAQSIRVCLENPERLAAMKANTSRLAFLNSGEAVAKRILSDGPAGTN